MEKRLVLAFALTILVFIGFQQFQRRTPDETVKSQASKPAPIQKQDIQTPEQAAPAAQAVPQATASPEDTTATPQKLTVKGDLYKAVVDNRGAILTEWILNQYKSGQNRIFEMITANHGRETRSLPAALSFDDKGLAAQANNELYQIEVNGQPYDGQELTPPVTAVFKLRRGGLSIEKQFSFEKDNYIVNLSIVPQLGGKPIEGKLLLGQDIGPEQEHISSPAKLGIAYYSGGKARHEGPPKEEFKKIDGELSWIGLEMQYFTLIAIPSKPIPYFSVQKLPVKTEVLGGKPVDRDLLKVSTPINGSLKYTLYIGAKKPENLKAVQNVDIGGAIDYGMFSIIVHPLLASLRWIHQYVLNYGYAIVILTLLLSLLLFPFRLKQMLSMKKMQVVQPKVKAIQEKYRRYKKTDPKRAEMNQEIMALYKEHNVNPLGGCLPLILQMPLLFAFYSLLPVFHRTKAGAVYLAGFMICP